MSEAQPRDSGLVVTATAFITSTYVLATVFVALRLVSRARIARHVATDDWLCIVSWVFATALSCMGWRGVSSGWDLTTATSENSDAALSGVHAFTAIYPVAHALPKLSVLVYYLSISRTSQVFRNSTIATIVVLALTTIIVTGALAAARGGIMQVWEKTTKIYLGYSPANILVDMLLPLLPIPTIHKQLVLPRRQKLIIYATLGCGGFLGIVSITRIVLLQQAELALRTENWRAYDRFLTLAILWTFVDVNLSVAVTCVPALKPLFMKLVPSLLKHDTKAPRASNDDAGKSPSTSSQAGEQDYPSGKTLHVTDMSLNASLNVPNIDDIGVAAFANTMEPERSSYLEDEDESQGAHLNFLEARRRFTLHNVPAAHSWKYLWNTSILFLLIGFTNSFVEALTQSAKAQTAISSEIALVNRATFYGSYLVAPILVAYPIMGIWSFKGCSMTGLLILSIGCLVFWPAATLGPNTSAIAFSYGIVGSGTSMIETGASLYSFLSGPCQYAVTRVLIMHAFQAFGSVLAPLVVSGTIPVGNLTVNAPFSALWAYLVLACFGFVMLFWYQCLPLYELNDEELEQAFRESEPKRYETLQRHSRQVYFTLAFCVLGIFAITGAQEDGHATLNSLTITADWNIDLLAFEAISRGVLTISRLAFGIMAIYVKPRWILFVCAVVALVCSGLTTTLTGPSLAAVYLLERVAQSSIWPMGFAMAVHCMGKRSRIAAALAVTARIGGVIFPAITYALQKAGKSYHSVQSVTIACFAVVFLWALAVNAFTIARLKVDGWVVHTPKESPVKKTGDGRKKKSKAAAIHQFSMDFETSCLDHRDDENDNVVCERGKVHVEMYIYK